MGSDKGSPLHDPGAWFLRTCLLVLGAVIALNLAVAYLRVILPWLIGTLAFAAIVWVVVAVARWWRSRY